MAVTRHRVGPLLTRPPGRGYGRPGLVVVVIAAVLAVTFATGYTTTRALTGDDSAWLRKGVTIAHINGPSARYDSAISGQPVRLAASASDPVQVVQDPNGQVYTADSATRKIFRMDLSTMTASPGPSGTGVLAAGSTIYIVDRTLRTLTPVDPQLHAIGRPIHIPAPIQSETIAGDGTVYVGQNDGAVTVVRQRRPHTVQVAPRGDPLVVTVVGTRAEAVDPQNGTVYTLDGGQPSRITLPGPAGAPVEVGPNQPDGPLWLAQGNVLAKVDLSNGQTRSAPLADGHHFGAPVANGGRLYVPDDTAGQVSVFDSGTLAPTDPLAIAVPSGAPGATDIELIAKDHQVWIDNPTSRDGKVVNPNGNVRTIDKGTGDEVVDPNAAPAPPTPAPPTAAPAPASNPVAGVAPTPVPAPSLTSSPVPSLIPSPTPLPGGGPTTPALPPTITPPPVPSSPQPSLPTPPQTPSQVPVPTDLAGQAASAACAELQASGLVCHVQYQAQASSNQRPNVVAASKPNSGSVAKGTTVELVVDEVAVPRPGASTDPQSYCAQADAAGFTCTPRNLGPGTPANVVVSVTPPAGTLAPPGTAVAADYHSPVPPPPPVVPPRCVGLMPSACPMPAGLTAVTVNQTTASGVACNTVWNESPPAGVPVPQGTTVTLTVDPNCAVPLYELHHTGTNIWYLNTADAPPPGSPASAWTTQSSVADAYPLRNGACGLGAGAKAGTVPLYKWEYPSGGPAGNYNHFYFTDLATWHDQGWQRRVAIACVFDKPVSGSVVAVYGHYINRPDVPGDWSWELTPNSAAPYPVWYQVQRP